jgi:hypothetical protein
MTDQTDDRCWFCGKSDKFLIYEEEFDTFVHVACIRKTLEDEAKVGETAAAAQIMSYLLGDGI